MYDSVPEGTLEIDPAGDNLKDVHSLICTYVVGYCTLPWSDVSSL